jgi:integrase/recombinase XerC
MKGNPANFSFESSDKSLVEYYIESRSLEQNTEKNYRIAWAHLTRFAEKEGIEIREINEQDAARFCEYLKSKDSLSDISAEKVIGNLSTMVNWYTNRGLLDYNPFSMVLEDDPFDYRTETLKREVGINELRDSLQVNIRPRALLLIVLLLKTGVRLGEAINLDYRDINIDHPLSDRMPRPRAEISNKEDTLYVDSSISAGEVHNGEVRECGNKPNSYRAIPIDDELKRTLAWYIAMSPASPSDAEPLFRQDANLIGERMNTKNIRENDFNPWAKKNGWHKKDGENNVTPHWCRHWFTTMLRKRIDQDEVEMGSVEHYIKGLRGDTGDDVIDVYTHNWGDNQWMRDAYLDNIPLLFSE